jgi:hypothetical protein
MFHANELYTVSVNSGSLTGLLCLTYRPTRLVGSCRPETFCGSTLWTSFGNAITGTIPQKSECMQVLENLWSIFNALSVFGLATNLIERLWPTRMTCQSLPREFDCCTHSKVFGENFMVGSLPFGNRGLQKDSRLSTDANVNGRFTLGSEIDMAILTWTGNKLTGEIPINWSAFASEELPSSATIVYFAILPGLLQKNCNTLGR